MSPSKQDHTNYYQHQESERLIYRPFEENDCVLWEPFFHEIAVLGFLGMHNEPFKSMSTLEKASSWIEKQVDRQKNGSIGQLAIIEKASGKFIGVGGVIARTDDVIGGEWEITYALLSEARGKGYATEQSRYFKNWIFENTQKESVVSVVQIDNLASQNVAEKNGMTVDREMHYFGMDVRLNRVFRKP